MTTLDRRAALGLFLGGAAVAAGATMLASDAEAVTLPKLDTSTPESLAEDAQYIVIGRRRRRRRCWWRRGRRYCGW